MAPGGRKVQSSNFCGRSDSSKLFRDWVERVHYKPYRWLGLLSGRSDLRAMGFPEGDPVIRIGRSSHMELGGP